jgi:hypothetical protein
VTIVVVALFITPQCANGYLEFEKTEVTALIHSAEYLFRLLPTRASGCLVSGPYERSE